MENIKCYGKLKKLEAILFNDYGYLHNTNKSIIKSTRKDIFMTNQNNYCKKKK